MGSRRDLRHDAAEGAVLLPLRAHDIRKDLAAPVGLTQHDRRRRLIAARFEAEHEGRKLEVSRFKGLGEMDWQELGVTTMAPATRTLLQVTVDEAAIADEIFSTLMGDDVEARRGFIQTNAKDVRFLDI